MSQRIFLLFFGTAIAGSGVFMVHDSIKGRPAWQTMMFGLFFALIGCLMIFAGISKRTKSSKTAGEGNI